MAEQEGSFGTPEEQLQVLNEAIYKILVGGQSYKIGTRSLTRADLSALIAERNRLETILVLRTKIPWELERKTMPEAVI